MFRDFRFALRVLASRPVFALVAALSIGLGIGANSAIFGLVDALWFRPLAVPHSDEIVRVFSVTDQDREAAFSYPEYLDLKNAGTLREVVAIGGRGATLLEGQSRELHTLNLVTSNFFTALDVKPAFGRVFTPHDEVNSDSPPAVVLGNSFWERHYGADPNIVGKQIRIQRTNEVLFTVIGVLPKSFRGLATGDDRDLWFSKQEWARLGNVRELEQRGSRWFHILGRLAPAATEKSSNAEIATIASRMADAWPETNRGRRAVVIPDLRYRLQQAGTNGLALLAIVLLVVLISSVNVANLLLSRAGARGKEMAIRLALGASRGRLIRQLMTENFLLGIVGLAAGLAIGSLLISILPALIVQPPGLYRAIDFQFDSRVLVFSLIVSIATIVFFGLAPAWMSARPDLVPALKGEFGRGLSGRRWPLRNWLVVAEVALSMTLLASAGVLVRSFANTRSGDLGFGRKQLLLVWLASDHAKPALYQDVMAHYAALPGVRSVAAAVRAPLSLSSNGMFQRVTFQDRKEFEIKYNSVTRNFLNTMGTPIVRGRNFEERDEIAGANSVVVNERMAERFWAGEEAIGKALTVGGKPHRVIGVARNAPINEVGETAEPYLYLAYWPNFESEVTFLIETQGDAIALAQAARRELKSVDARLDPLTITTENDLIRFSAQRYQVTAELVAALGALGLLLTAVGLYGVVSYGVSQRTRELGIRMALGADRNDTLWLVLREVAMLGLIGIAIGLPLALTATRAFSTLLFGVSPWDAPAFVTALIVLAFVLLAAGWLPARRATSIQPSSALRQ
jgi:putative ABC transport system permease protein